MAKKELIWQAIDWTTFQENVVCFGRTLEGKSVAIKIRGTYFPFFINVSKWDNYKIKQVLAYLKNNSVKHSTVKRKQFDCRLKITEDGTGLEDISYNFIKIEAKNVIDFYTWRKKFRFGLQLPSGFEIGPCELFNAHYVPILMFFHETNFQTNGWYGSYRYSKPQRKFSTCDIELELDLSHLNNYKDYKERSKIVVASYDLETEGTDPEKDAIFQVGITVKTLYDDTTIKKYMLNIGESLPIEGVEVVAYKNECELLQGTIDTLAKIDFDVLTGYNIFGFDNNMFFERAKKYDIENGFRKWNRVKSTQNHIVREKMSGKGEGFQTQRFFNIEGRVQMDLLPIMRKNYKLDGYSLSAVSQHFIDDDKVDLPYQMIWEIWNKGDNTPKDMQKLGIYCIQDTLLPLTLIEKLSLLTNAMEYSNIAYFPLGRLFTYGETAKSYSQICRQAGEEKYVFAEKKRVGNPYQGATVLEPKKGMYLHDKVAVLDFASLYPSIMIAFNLCPTTLCVQQDLIDTFPDLFVTNNVNGRKISFFQGRKGVVPKILETLLTERKRVKKQMKEEEPGFQKQLLDAKQLALKISCNSIYGFFGTINGVFPCTEISSTTTFLGRKMIDDTKKAVEKDYKGCDVIYGDTDSVMIKMPRGKTDKELFHLRTSHRPSK